MAETKYGIDDTVVAMGGKSFLEYANTPYSTPSLQTVLAYTATGVVTGFGTAVLAGRRTRDFVSSSPLTATSSVRLDQDWTSDVWPLPQKPRHSV
jgi:hypothetical protein